MSLVFNHNKYDVHHIRKKVTFNLRIKYLTPTQVQINNLLAIFHHVLYTNVCYPEAQFTSQTT